MIMILWEKNSGEILPTKYMYNLKMSQNDREIAELLGKIWVLECQMRQNRWPGPSISFVSTLESTSNANWASIMCSSKRNLINSVQNQRVDVIPVSIWADFHIQAFGQSYPYFVRIYCNLRLVLMSWVLYPMEYPFKEGPFGCHNIDINF